MKGILKRGKVLLKWNMLGPHCDRCSLMKCSLHLEDFFQNGRSHSGPSHFLNISASSRVLENSRAALLCWESQNLSNSEDRHLFIPKETESDTGVDVMRNFKGTRTDSSFSYWTAGFTTWYSGEVHIKAGIWGAPSGFTAVMGETSRGSESNRQTFRTTRF